MQKLISATKIMLNIGGNHIIAYGFGKEDL
jgi:hypothetical protein